MCWCVCVSAVICDRECVLVRLYVLVGVCISAVICAGACISAVICAGACVY